MSKTPTPDDSDRKALLLSRTLTEQQWAYERVLEHLSFREMRQRVSAPVERGGLGYDLSESALRGLVRGYRERMADVERHDLELHRERELNDLDALHRHLAAIVADPVDWNATRLAALELGYTDVREAIEREPNLLRLHNPATVMNAVRELRGVSESRRKLLGLDAPAKTDVQVTMRDAVTDELNAMLARAGREPIEVPE